MKDNDRLPIICSNNIDSVSGKGKTTNILPRYRDNIVLGNMLEDTEREDVLE